VAVRRYCHGDADLYTLSLGLDVKVFNASKTPLYVRESMIPWVAKVAASLSNAQAGHFLYEITQSHFPQQSKPSGRLIVKPGKSVTLHTDYGLVARYDSSFSYPKSISAGKFAIVFVLRPETELAGEAHNTSDVESLTTEPLLIEVPAHPKVTSCALTR